MASSLPNELIEEILLRLPVKSIKRFQSVCPAWKTLILTPAFVKSYGERNKDLKKFMIYSDETNVTYSCSLNCGEVVAEKVPQIFQPCETAIVGSCDGLLLVVSRNPYRLCIWNPSTRESKQLPNPTDKNTEADSLTVYGFGSASFSGKQNFSNYTVLIVDRNDILPEISKTFVYNTSTNSWRRMEGIPYRSWSNSPAVLVNAKLYFFAKNLDSKWVLLGFDIGDEEFKEVLEPDYDGYYHTISELSGDLCVVCNNHNAGWSSVWVMKEYGGKESWANMLRIDRDDIMHLGDIYFHIDLLLYYEDGKILLRTEICNYNAKQTQYHYPTILFSYDCKNHRAKNYKIDGVPGRYSTITYVESLISPNAL